ncbi:MAG: hypothetical protein AAF958_11090 [Planctomycetota bacterium]
MAKKRSGVSKTQLILNYKKDNPDAKPKAISEALSAGKVKVSPAYVSTILSNSKRSGGKTKSVVVKRGTKARSTKRAVATASSGGDGGLSVDTLLKVKRLADEVGISDLKTAISAYEKLTNA